MTKNSEKVLEKVHGLLQHLVVLQLFQMGATQSTIARSIGSSKSTVNALLKGIAKQK